ncbi:MAG: hypothetical protein HRU19_18505 [Pseudobacteriovorax sp.]|nr:hypothetical protein [Pseudobacteriovorax sp.]
MNDNNDPQSNAAFNTNTSPDTQASTNPFTGDLKGEFSSDFGTNTNAVSQIFKSGGFSSENRTKYIAIGVIAVVMIGAIVYLTSSPSEDPFADDFAGDLADDELADDELGEDEDLDALDEGEADESVADAADEPDPVEEATPTETVEEAPAVETAEAPVATGSFQLIAPADGARRPYDETAAAAEFSWDGAADRINFSRNQSMRPLSKSISLGGATSYAFENPYPGTWYWQVENSEGVSETRMFRITAPDRRSFPVSNPQDGGSIAGNGGVVSWQAGERIARYAVEIVPSGSTWTNPSYRFGTSGTAITLQGVGPGSYDFRVGAFSEVSGRWEWQYLRNVNVQ